MAYLNLNENKIATQQPLHWKRARPIDYYLKVHLTYIGKRIVPQRLYDILFSVSLVWVKRNMVVKWCITLRKKCSKYMLNRLNDSGLQIEYVMSIFLMQNTCCGTQITV